MAHSLIENRDLPVAMIVGKSGVGKSSLLNHLVGSEVAAVGHVGSCTQETQLFRLEDRIDILDTRGLDEVGAGDSPRKQLIDAICRECPDAIIYCLDGSRRDWLDTELQGLESVLECVFRVTRSEPDILLVVNKVDALEPAGHEFLPSDWRTESSDKARNIRDRVALVESIAKRSCRNRIRMIEPTFLEWYTGARSWNLDGIKTRLFEYSSQVDNECLSSLCLSNEEFRSLFRAELCLVDHDICCTQDLSAKDVKRKWRQWFFAEVGDALISRLGVREFFSTVNSELCEFIPPITLSLHVPNDRIRRQVWALELAAFRPYCPLQGWRGSAVLDESWQGHLDALLIANGISHSEVEEIQAVFNRHFKALISPTAWGKVLLVAIATAATAWAAAPWIGGVIGSLMGLSGAAATSAGLAWLGLGSIAAGGFGMFGGTVVVVGSGALLGGGVSRSLLNRYASNLTPQQLIIDCSKFLTLYETVLASGNPELTLRFQQNFLRMRYRMIREHEDDSIMTLAERRRILDLSAEEIETMRFAKNHRFFRERSEQYS